MNKLNQFLSAGLLMFAVSTAQAQIKLGDNPTTINTNSALEIESSNKGLLFPRVALTGLDNPAPLAGHVKGMVVYNTAATGSLEEGLYANDGSGWHLLNNQQTFSSNEFGSNAPTGGCTTGVLYTDTLSTSSTLGKQWTCSAGVWKSYVSPANTAWYINNTNIDAGGNKNSIIQRTGWLRIAPTGFTGDLGYGTADKNGIQLAHWGNNLVRLDVQMSAGPNIMLSKNATPTNNVYTNYLLNNVSIGSVAKGTGNTVVYNTTSDVRLKENIKATHYSVEDLMKIEVKDYNYKADSTKAQTTGFLAQDLHKVYPEAVTVGGENEKEKPWQVDYAKVTPLLVKAIQDQQKEIELLKSTLDERLAQLERNSLSIKKRVKLSKVAKKKSGHRFAFN